MSTRYPRSSYNDETIGLVAAAKDLLQGQITAGRVFWLRGISATNTDIAAGELFIFDQATEGAAVATTQRLTLYVPTITTSKFDFAAPGIKFVHGVIAAVAAHPLDGVFAAYAVTIYGYEE